MNDRPRHPSGKPVRRDKITGHPRWNIPDEGYVMPRLKVERKDLSLVGFRYDPPRDRDDE